MKRSDLLFAISSRIAGFQRPLPMGVLAALRRMDPENPAGSAALIYGFLADCGLDLEGADDPARWALLAHILALARGRHDRKVPIGKALVEIKLGENRLKQLLSADGEVLRELLPRLGRRLDANAQAADFGPFMELVFAVDAEALEQSRLKIARSYVVANAIEKRNAS